MDFFQPVLERVKAKYPKCDADLIMRAYEYARDAHEGQKRFSGEPYIIHPVAVLDILLEFNPDEEMLVAALLHDVSEDTDKTLEDIESEFGTGVADLVRGLEKLSKIRSRIDEPEIENLRMMFVHMAADLRIIIIKLCDRLHNMTTLEYVKPHKQERIARETLHVYVPIAARLGIYNLKGRLEDLCFEFLYPQEYGGIHEQLSSYSRMTEPVIEEIKRTLQKHLVKAGYENAVVAARLKSSYSIYSKLKKKGRGSIDGIYDVFAMRVILPDEERNGEPYTGHLYGVLGLIHSLWTPLQRRFKDYVAVPKANGYRSLHTTVVGLGPKSRHQPTEIQIRTQSMHGEAKWGIASHWLYSETQGTSSTMNEAAMAKSAKVMDKLSWLKALTSLQDEVPNNQEFIADLHADIFNDRIFVLTPVGDVKDLPRGATPIDFAYVVHSEIGNRCVMARVNGSIVPLDYELRNGNVVEIVTRENAEPNQYWLSFVKTSSAKSRIKSWFRHHADPQKSLREGREILNRHLEQVSKPMLDAELSLLKIYKGKRQTLREREEILREIGRGMRLPNVIMKNLFPIEELLRSKSRAIAIKKKRVEKEIDLTKEVIVDGYTDLPIKIASCCQPKNRDSITGFVTRGQGITVHKRSCKVVQNEDADRCLALYWKSCDLAPRYRVALEIVMEDRVGLLSDISNVISRLGVNITGIALGTETDNTFTFREFEVEVTNYDQLATLIQKLQKISNVKQVKKLD